MSNAAPGPRLQALLEAGLREVMLDADYRAEPLWAVGSREVFGNLALDDFELEESLATELRAWVDDWETERAVSPSLSAPADRIAEWEARGRTLANKVQAALRGHLTVYYAYDRHPERPVWEQI